MSDVMRSDDEIIRYYRRIAPFDFFGVWGTELLIRVPLKTALPFLKDAHGWDEETWSRAQRKNDRESIVAEMEDFIQDAIDRVTRHSKHASLSTLDYYRAWAWLAKDMDVFEYLIDERNFPNFGAPMIKAVIDRYDFQELMPDNEIRKNLFLNMAAGRKCNDLCVRGCGAGKPTALQRAMILPTQPQTSTLILPK